MANDRGRLGRSLGDAVAGLGTLDGCRDLLRYLEALAPEDWDRDCGVWEADGQPASIRSDIEALTADYLGHSQEVEAWSHISSE